MHAMLCVLLIIISIVNVSTKFCIFVRDLPVAHRKSISESWDRTTLSGCINDTSFKSKIVGDVSIGCDSNSIPKLERYFMTNMESLWRVYIGSCNIETIETGAFSDLPNIKHLKIRGNRIKEISSGVFNVLPSIETLYIFYSKVSQVEDNAFSNLPNLENMSLEKNRLDHLKKEWFTNTSNIKNFIVSHNFIQKIPAGMFHGWRKLELVQLNSNAITVIEDGTFKDSAPYIKNINLHHNRITSLSPNIVSDSVFIDTLIISANLLNYLSDEFLEKLRVSNLYIFGNPFKCPCLEKINRIVLEKDVKLDDPKDRFYVSLCKNWDVPLCGFSTNYSQTCIESVDKEVTKRVISMMIKVGYNSLRTETDEQCAMFDKLA